MLRTIIVSLTMLLKTYQKKKKLCCSKDKSRYSQKIIVTKSEPYLDFLEHQRLLKQEVHELQLQFPFALVIDSLYKSENIT